MKTVGIYRKAFPRISETFITEPAQKLLGYNPIFISCKMLGETPFKHISISQNDFWRIKQSIHLTTRSPHLFGHPEVLQNLDLIHAHFGPDGVYAMKLAEKLKIPLIVTFHGYDITLKRKAILHFKPPLYYQMILHEEEFKKKAAAFIAVSKFIQSKLIENDYPENKIIQHYIGIDIAKFYSTSKETDERYILCVGRHTEKKGIDVLLRAFSQIVNKHPDVSLIQIGTGKLTAKLHSLSKQLGITHRVRFLGAQPYEVVQKFMRGAEIFALPSHTAKNGDSEALGLVFNEASACCKPIVATWHGGIPEAVLDGETGFLVPEKDDKTLAKKLDILLEDRTLGKRMGQRGREFVEEFFEIRKQTKKLEDIYDSVTTHT